MGTFYRQCIIDKPSPDVPGRVPGGTTYMVAWIDERDAAVGLTDGEWTIRQVGEYRASDKEIRNVHRTMKRHTIATGDDLPKQRST